MEPGTSGSGMENNQAAGTSQGQDAQERRRYAVRAEGVRRRFTSLIDVLYTSLQRCEGGPEFLHHGRDRQVQECAALQTKYPSASGSAQPTRLDILLDMPPASPECQMKHGWNPEDCSRNICVKELTFHKYPSCSTDSIRGKVGFTEGLHVWEVSWLKCQRIVRAVIGVATRDAPLHCFHLPFETDDSFQNPVDTSDQFWGWDICRKKLYHGSSNNGGVTYPTLLYHDETFIVPNKFLVVLDMDEGTLSFIVDGQHLGIAFRGLCGYTLYPIASATWAYCQCTMKYIGGLHHGPRPLKDLCRHVIRKRVGKHQLEKHITQLSLPQTLQEFMLHNY